MPSERPEVTAFSREREEETHHNSVDVTGGVMEGGPAAGIPTIDLSAARQQELHTCLIGAINR